MNDLTGKTIAGRYRVDTLLGRGGMGDVYKVWDRQRAAYLVMKILPTELAEDKVFLRRFIREAESLSALNHPQIARFYGLEQAGRLTYILMDFVEGETLRSQIFESQKPYTTEQVIQFMRPVCSALQYAHQRGFVHCDLKPANIMVNPKGEYLLTDYGIARMLENSAAITKNGARTPEYTAPEQILGEQPSAQTDIYALGIMLYELLTGGERPFTGEEAAVDGSTSDKVRWEQVNLTPPTLWKFVPGIPRELEKVVLKCLEKEPSRRYACAFELLQAVESALGSVKASRDFASAITSAVERPSRDSNREQGQIPQPDIKTKRSPVNPGAAIAVVIGLLATVGIFSLLIGEIRSPLIQGGISTWKALNPTKTALPDPSPTVVVTAAPSSLPSQIQASNGISMQLVPAGKFTMGSDTAGNASPAHLVFLDDYYIDQFEVTNSQYSHCVDAGACKPPVRNTQHVLFCSSMTKIMNNCIDSPDLDYYPVESNSPVIFLDWNMAQTYCQWRGARLPTEAEWEKAARGIDGRVYPWGNDINCTRANYSGCYSQKLIYPTGPNLKPYYAIEARLSPVGKFHLGVSPYGLEDMAGNAWEWVADWYDENYYKNSPAKDPPGPTSGTLRIYRGGAFMLDANLQDASYRASAEPSTYSYDIGFRCARNVKP